MIQACTLVWNSCTCFHKVGNFAQLRIPDDKDLSSAEHFRNSRVKYFLSVLSCVPPTILGEWVPDLINCTVHDQRRLQYIICANQVAYAFLTCLEPPAEKAMQRELLRSKNRYKDNVVSALRQLDTRPRPDVALLYALQSTVRYLVALLLPRKVVF